MNTNFVKINNQEIKAKTQLLWIGIGAIGMFFAGLTSAYIVRKAEGNWLEFNIPESFVFSTVTIILSSILLILAKKQIKKNNIPYFVTVIDGNGCEREDSAYVPNGVNRILVVFITGVLVLGVTFAIFQINGWRDLIQQGVFLTGAGSNASGSFLYVITLSHLLHLFGGLISLIFVLVNVLNRKYSSTNYLGFDLATTYWHFLGILWIYLFIFLNYI